LCVCGFIKSGSENQWLFVSIKILLISFKLLLNGYLVSWNTLLKIKNDIYLIEEYQAPKQIYIESSMTKS
jgi:hypothetical protein